MKENGTLGGWGGEYVRGIRWGIGVREGYVVGWGVRWGEGVSWAGGGDVGVGGGGGTLGWGGGGAVFTFIHWGGGTFGVKENGTLGVGG